MLDCTQWKVTEANSTQKKSQALPNISPNNILTSLGPSGRAGRFKLMNSYQIYPQSEISIDVKENLQRYKYN